MSFALFLLLNVVLLIRPDELLGIEGLRLYLITIVLCTATSISKLQKLLTWESLRNRPVAVCVLLFFASTIISLCVLGRFDEAFFGFGPEFAKVILYYFLFIAIVDTPERFRAFVAALIGLTIIQSAIALAEYHGYVDFPSIKPVAENYEDPASGEMVVMYRMVSSGLFNDPNDLCLLLGLGILSCIYR